MTDYSGFTLLELLVAMVICIILGAGGFTFFANQTRALADQSATLDAAEAARSAFDFMAKDIRLAGANPAGTWAPAANSCAAGLGTARADQLTIRSDGGNGGTVNGAISADETTTYSYDAGTKRILRTVNGVSETLISNVNSLTLQYYVGATAVTLSGSPAQVPTASCDKVTSVKITVQVRTPKALTTNEMTLTAQVALRNRKAVLARL